MKTAQNRRPSVRELASITGFGRDSLATRIRRFGLGKNWRPKDLFELKPLDGEHASKLSLEEERAALAREQRKLAEWRRGQLEKRLADVNELLAAHSAVMGGIAAQIRASKLAEDLKEILFEDIVRSVQEWAADYEITDRSPIDAIAPEITNPTDQ